LQNVYCIGETVLDLIFKDGASKASIPGGSMLNASVSLGRAGIPVCFISEFGNDQAGNMIDDFLRTNGVNTNFIYRYKDGKTALALAFLDQSNHAEYSFYKSPPKKRMNILFPGINPGDIVLFGSFFSLEKEVRSKVIKFIRKARAAGAIIIYDPNFRKPHLAELQKVMPWIMENMSLADIVRGSDEDFLHIFGTRTGDKSFEKVRESGCQILLYTKNKKGVELICEKKKHLFPAPVVKTVSTIGAGDAFNAGLIHGIASLGRNGMKMEHGRWKVEKDKWMILVDRGLSFAGEVCKTLDNCISDEFANRFRKI
jgi:fructokinase